MRRIGHEQKTLTIEYSDFVEKKLLNERVDRDERGFLERRNELKADLQLRKNFTVNCVDFSFTTTNRNNEIVRVQQNSFVLAVSY